MNPAISPLKNAPIVDAIVELRFEATVPSQVVAGLLYNSLIQEGYGDFEELPITQLPSNVKDEDVNLRYSAHYRMKTANYLVSVSQRVIGIAAICYGDNEYQGWVSYKQEVEKVLGVLRELQIVDSFSRIGVRYINLFQTENIAEKLNIKLDVPDASDLVEERLAGFVYANDGMTTRVNFATNATMTFGSDSLTLSGAILDIDSAIEQDVSFESVGGYIEKGHTYTEEAFRKLLSEQLLEELQV